MKYNAYDLRKSGYRYLRGSSPYVEEAERCFPGGILMPSGMAAISLLLQYLQPKSIWYPYDLYQGTYELISLLGIKFSDKNPDVVVYDNPSFGGNKEAKMPKFKNKPIVIVDNSVMPDKKSFKSEEYDYLVTSLSKYHTNCETVLGLITLNDKRINKADKIREQLKELRWKSGYVIFDAQCRSLQEHFGKTKRKNFEKFLKAKALKAQKISRMLTERGFDAVAAGTLIFVVMPDKKTDAQKIAETMPFELRPTYGADRTFVSYSYCEDNLRYFSAKHASGQFIRISPGIDYTAKEIVRYIQEAMRKAKQKTESEE